MSDDTLTFSADRRQSRANLTASWLGGGTLAIYDAPRPPTPDDALTTQIKLCTFDLPTRALSIVGGKITGTGLEAALVVNGGTPTWGRFADIDGIGIADADAGTTGTAIRLSSAYLIEGAYVSVVQFEIDEP